MENRCVCCGEPIPEGRQVCMSCTQRYFSVDKNNLYGYIELTDLYSDTKILFNLNAIEFISDSGGSIMLSINGRTYFVKESYKKIIEMIQAASHK